MKQALCKVQECKIARQGTTVAPLPAQFSLSTRPVEGLYPAGKLTQDGYSRFTEFPSCITNESFCYTKPPQSLV